MVMNLNRHERFMALLFGAFIDFDHLMAVPRFLADNSLSSMLTIGFEDPSGMPWKSLLHRPVGAFVVLAMTAGWRFFIPAAFWGLHMLMDLLQQGSYFYSLGLEVSIFTGVCATIVALDFFGVTRTHGAQTIREYLEDLRVRLMSLLRPLRGLGQENRG